MKYVWHPLSLNCSQPWEGPSHKNKELQSRRLHGGRRRQSTEEGPLTWPLNTNSRTTGESQSRDLGHQCWTSKPSPGSRHKIKVKSQKDNAKGPEEMLIPGAQIPNLGSKGGGQIDHKMGKSAPVTWASTLPLHPLFWDTPHDPVTNGSRELSRDPQLSRACQGLW